MDASNNLLKTRDESRVAAAMLTSAEQTSVSHAIPSATGNLGSVVANFNNRHANDDWNAIEKL